MSASKPKPHCMYCGKETKRGKGKGEHIVPEAIGGALTLLEHARIVVCGDCNSGPLSRADKELCSRSYLSAVASQQIDAHLWQVWDVDHRSGNELVDARPEWAADGVLNSLHCYPQITFDRDGQHVRGDAAEARQFGNEHFGRVMFKAVRACFDRYRGGEKRCLHFERIEPRILMAGHRLSPRVFSSHTIAEIAKDIYGQSFTLRYCSKDDRRFGLNALSNLKDGRDMKKWEHKPGTRRPSIACCFDVGGAVRGLMKVGLNLVAAFCPNTPVNPETFGRAIRIVRQESSITEAGVKRNGFIEPDGVREIRAGGNDHSFRLTHLDGEWHVLSSFFGGKIGAYVRFPGPSNEAWRTAEILAPLRSKAWSFNSSSILTSTRIRVSMSGAVVAPSIRLQDAYASIDVQFVRPRQPKATA